MSAFMKSGFLKAEKGNRPFHQVTSNGVLSRKEKKYILNVKIKEIELILFEKFRVFYQVIK